MFQKNIQIDLDSLSNAIQHYDTIISSFEDSLKCSEQAINALKSSGWKSGASVVYFMTYEDTWKKNMKKRIQIIKHLKDCLIKAQTEYTAVYDELIQIDSNL